MTKKHNFIEINGKRYDASSGAPLGQATDTKKTVHQPSAAAVISVPIRIIEAATPTAAKTPHTVRRSAKDVKSHAPQPARTLMRQAVSKPKPAARTVRLKVVGQLDLPAKGSVVIVKPSVSRLDAARLRQAQHVKRSHLISRFNRRQLVADPQFVATTTSVTVSSNTVAPAPQPAQAKGHRPKTTADILEMAIQNATSHLQPPVKPAKRQRVWHRRHAAPAH